VDAPPDRRWFPLHCPCAGARVRLLCLPCAGKGASSFRDWPDLLPAIEVLAVTLPGREHRVEEPPAHDLDALVAALTAAALRLPPGPPLALFGHSLGALLAFLLARALVAAGRPPVHLFAAAARAPQRPPRRILHDLPLPALLAEMLHMGGTSPRVIAEPGLVRLLEPALRADLQLAETNVAPARPALPLPITVLAGRDDAGVTRDDLEAWADVAGAGCELLFLPGGHFFVQTAQAGLLATVAARLGVSAR
jgi:medium-chain acyl-[acyl-carrier-protein] hydrolase